MEKNVLILRGISGSGKSTIARSAKRWLEENGNVVRVVSADDHFMVAGTYQFDPAQLDVAHAKCQHKFNVAIDDYETNWIIVDNTNITRSEMSPYISACNVRSLVHNRPVNVRIVQCQCYTSTAIARNEHFVPIHTIRRQVRDFEGVETYWGEPINVNTESHSVGGLASRCVERKTIITITGVA